MFLRRFRGVTLIEVGPQPTLSHFSDDIILDLIVSPQRRLRVTNSNHCHAKKEIVALYKEIVEGTISDGWI